MSILTGFTAGLLLITLSELGDKTFFIGAILAMRHSRRWVFTGVTAALLAMTILSVLIGQVVTALPHVYVQGVAIALFLGFGGKLLYDAWSMARPGDLDHEQADALAAVEQREQGLTTWSTGAILAEAFTLTFMAEWGDRTQLATITLAAAHHPIGIVAGASLGHTITTCIAVICGKLVAGRISERLLTGLGGGLFVLFGLITALRMGT
ncbi:GDT1-like protein [Halomicronema hongdechloris C2206]|uniref:GDT1 family protein n=1 Tax=Halomicronema hongdechloris C2206 TaxID=1641165 RepID=A0A1Z3HK47_9CYAN|nr:TMEM165/GDT1 family protein [Halomicronema hongdechloris]ASC70457.1 GDT1-like protein [Halomicronema hongdechloris C2206]